MKSAAGVGADAISRPETEASKAQDDRSRATERELAMSLSLLEAALESTADGLLLVDREGRITRFNRRFLELWRIPDGVVASRDDDRAIAFVLSQLVDPDRFVTKVRELYASPEAESFDVLKFRDGRVFERYSRPQLVDGESVGRVWSFRDVTERIRAEETRFRSVTESAQDAIVTANAAGAIVGWNSGARETFAYADSEIMGQPLMNLVPERYREAHGPGFGRVVAAGEGRVVVRTADLCCLRKDGTEFPCEVSINTWKAGTEFHFTAFIRDISERKRAEEALMMQARVLGSMKESVVVTDERGIICYANAALEASFGYARSELVGRHVGILENLSPDDSARRIAPILEQLEATGSWSGECPNRRKDGSTFTSEVSVTTLTVNGKSFCVSVQEDVTERRAIQSKLLVSDRMASLGTLAAGVAHEMNNPLAYVTTNLAVLAEELQAIVTDPRWTARIPEMSAMVADASTGAERMRKIILGMKVFSRSDEERCTLQDVARVADSAIDLVLNEIRHRARLVRDFAPAPPVQADGGRLTQVFLNLLINAAQSIAEGHADSNEIRVSTGTDAHGRAVVEVRDTGSGIPAEARARVFDPFFTTKPVGVGTGLGLSICQNIVASLGGEISFETAPGGGTTFRVVLPPADEHVERRPPSHPVSARPAGRRARILVVDDEAMVGKSLCRALREHDVEVAVRASVAVERLLGDEQFDVILCDLMMPEMTGMDLYEQVAKARGDVARRFVFMTAGAFTASARVFLDSVENLRFDKPIDLQKLRAVIQTFVK